MTPDNESMACEKAKLPYEDYLLRIHKAFSVLENKTKAFQEDQDKSDEVSEKEKKSGSEFEVELSRLADYGEYIVSKLKL